MEVEMTAITRISIHAPARGATSKSNRSYRLYGFQSTLPRGERLVRLSSGENPLGFQSTLPRGERRLRNPRTCGKQDFNPRSREGSDSNFNQKSRLFSDQNCLKQLISKELSHFDSVLSTLFKIIVLFFRCECSAFFMYASFSHQIIK